MKVNAKVLELARQVKLRGGALDNFAREIGVNYSHLMRKLKGRNCKTVKGRTVWK